MASHRKSVWDVNLVRSAAWSSLLKLNPRNMMGNPVMFVVEIGSVITTALLILRSAQGIRFNLQITLWLWFTVLFANFAEAMAEGRGKAQAETLRRARSETIARRIDCNGQDRRNSQRQAARRRHGFRYGRRTDSRRRRNRRRRRLGRRIGHHRRVGPCDSRGWRRPLGRHRRHARSERLHQSKNHFESRRDLSRPHDRAGGRRVAAEDSQRNRSEHSAGGLDHHLSAGRGDAAAVRHLFRIAANRLRAGLVAGLPDSDHHRRPAVGDRHRRHGPPGAAQRSRDVRPRRRSRRAT